MDGVTCPDCDWVAVPCWPEGTVCEDDSAPCPKCGRDVSVMIDDDGTAYGVLSEEEPWNQ